MEGVDAAEHAVTFVWVEKFSIAISYIYYIHAYTLSTLVTN